MQRLIPALLLMGIFSGCLRVTVDPIEVNANVNVNVRLDKALNDFFGDLDKQSTTLSGPASTSTP